MPAVSKKQQRYFGYLLSNPEERKKKGISKKAAKDFAQDIQEVSPPAWGHTKAEKEKTKPWKPKSKIGGTAAAFKRALDDGRFKGLPGSTTKKEKTADMFKLMWSMKKKGDKPHYKPGTDKKYKKYQKESVENGKVDLTLKTDVNNVLKQDNKDYDRGLLAQVNKDGSYDVAYWYDKYKAYPVEVEIDGKSVKTDAKNIHIKFHPQLKKKNKEEAKDAMEEESTYEKLKKKIGSKKMHKEPVVVEGIGDAVKKGVKRHKDAVEKKKIKNRKAVPYAALAAQHEPEGEYLRTEGQTSYYKDDDRRSARKSTFHDFYKKARASKAKKQADEVRSDTKKHGVKFTDAKGSGRIRAGKKYYD